MLKQFICELLSQFRHDPWCSKQAISWKSVKTEAVAMQAPKRASRINFIQENGTVQQINWGASASLCLLPSCFQFPLHTALYKFRSRMKVPCHSYPLLQALVKIVNFKASSYLATNSNPGLSFPVRWLFF